MWRWQGLWGLWAQDTPVPAHGMGGRDLTAHPLCQALRGPVWLPYILVIPQPLAGLLGGPEEVPEESMVEPLRKGGGAREPQWA